MSVPGLTGDGARPSESETDSLGVSAESDASGRMRLGPTKARERRPSPQPGEEADLQEYGESLGADTGDADVMGVVREAFEAPLPSSWVEHVDEEGRVYFFNQVTEESTWSHPMDCVYRELIELIQRIKAAYPTGVGAELEARAVAVRTHLLEVHERAIGSLEGWSGPYQSDTGQYYFNESQGHSTWVSPIDGWEYELAVRHAVLHRSLLAGYLPAQGQEASAQPSEDENDVLMTPMLRLPLGLARRDEDVQNSARSFYTARDTARSSMSARSMGGLGEASPVRRAQRSPVPPEAPRPLSQDTTPLGEDHLEVTFGCTAEMRMPEVPARDPH